MKKLIPGLMIGLVFGLTSLRADDAAVESSKDTSRNPLTGTVTTKSKYKSKSSNEAGGKRETSVTDTTSVKKDGTVKHKVEKESESVPEKAE